MDIVLGAITSLLLGYLIKKLENIESKINRLEDTIQLIESRAPRRRNDVDE